MFELFIIYKFYFISGSNRYVYLYMEKNWEDGDLPPKLNPPIGMVYVGLKI